MYLIHWLVPYGIQPSRLVVGSTKEEIYRVLLTGCDIASPLVKAAPSDTSTRIFNLPGHLGARERAHYVTLVSRSDHILALPELVPGTQQIHFYESGAALVAIRRGTLSLHGVSCFSVSHTAEAVGRLQAGADWVHMHYTVLCVSSAQCRSDQTPAPGPVPHPAAATGGEFSDAHTLS